MRVLLMTRHFSVEGAILGKGLVIDHISHTGDMLSRTANDVGSDIEIFKSADIFLFCSAAISRKVMEANPLNIAHCPYNILFLRTIMVCILGIEVILMAQCKWSMNC